MRKIIIPSLIAAMTILVGSVFTRSHSQAPPHPTPPPSTALSRHLREPMATVHYPLPERVGGTAP